MNSYNRETISQASSIKYGATQKKVWRIDPDEEIVWSMRYHKSLEENKDPKTSTDDSELETGPAREISGSFNYKHPEKIQKQVKMFASFLPDEVLADVEDYMPREIDCCLLYGRITGMHCIIDRYHKMKADYKLKLTNQLNQFVGALVQEILGSGGDVLKFSPTAIVAIWKCTRASYMTQNVHVAIDCALVIKKQHGRFVLESGQKLRVDFAITAGSVYFSLIGNESCTKFLIFGSVYEDVRKARKNIPVKNIILSPKAMQFLHTFEYKLEPIENGNFFQVIGLTKMWKQVRRNEINEPSSLNRLEAPNGSYLTMNTLTNGSSISRQGSVNEFCLRPILEDLLENAHVFIHKIPKFFQEGIRNGILADEPIENFFELRDVVVVTIIIVTTIAKSMRMLKATDEIFKIVYRLAYKYKGYISYTSILDNSIMLTIYFGMKSSAHVMQVRSALKCSLEIMNVVKETSKIDKVTIGISSGKAYHTVIGHGLRHDLTLFGRIITDAILYSQSFSDKIVCDVDTFIQSRMLPNSFTRIKDHTLLNDELPSGCLYELLADDIEFSDEIPFYDQPFVGREKEIRTYENMIYKFFGTNKRKLDTNPLPNALIIKAYPKEGRTRLLHEMIRATPPQIPIHYMPFHSGEEDIPYLFIRRLFSREFDSDLLSTTKEERKEKLDQLLEDLEPPKLFWAINLVFHVNYPETEEFWNFTSAQKHATKLRIVKHLCSKVFTIRWVVAVDDGDYMDQESWDMLEYLFKTNTFFLILMKNRDQTLTKKPSYPNQPNQTKIKLGQMHPNFLGSLACQYLRVYAIPAEVLHLLQKKFNGNLNYVQNLLMNLRHRGHLAIKEVEYHYIEEEKLLTPSLNLLIPMSESEKHNLLTFISKKGKYDKNEFKRILWHLFVEGIQNKKFHLMREKIYEIVLKKKKIRVCILAKDIEMDGIQEDQTANIHITQVFENLLYPEQMILKCCTILGDTIPRMVLEHVLSLDYYSLLAPAVKSFFDKGVLCCGRGDFSDGVQFTVIRDKIIDPRWDEDMVCKCRGIYNQERYRSLPDYAYCGLLRFRQTRFRENIYELLRVSHKQDLHSKVIIFLHEETKRCRSCGRDAFDWDDHKRLDDYGDIKANMNGKRFSKRFDYELDAMPTTLNELFYDEISYAPKFSTSIRTGSKISLDSSYHAMEHDLQLMQTPLLSVRRMFGPVEISKLRMNMLLVRSFSTSDFTYCDCGQILSNYYREMITHCAGAGQLINLFDFMVKYAYSCIANKNISEAEHIIRKASVCIKDIFEMDRPPPIWKKNLFEAKLATISALAFKELGLYMESFDQLIIALKKYRIKLPKTRIGKLLSLAKVKLQKVLTFYALPELHTKKLSFGMAQYYVDVAEALDLFAKFLMAKGKWKAAELVASWALYKALNAQTSFVRICDSFYNMILIAIRNKNNFMIIALEVHALRYCYRKINRVEISELSAVCRMYMAIVLGKFIRAELEFSIHLGYIIIRIAASLNDTEKLLIISSYLVTVLTARLYLQEAASLLLELEFCAENMDDLPGQAWFHSQALLFHIEIGYCIIPYQQCLSFLEIQAIRSMEMTDNDAIKRLTTLMWLWCLRNEEWEQASRFESYIEINLIGEGPATIRSVLTLTYVLEGLLLIYCSKLDRSNLRMTKKLHMIIKKLMKVLLNESKFMKVFRPKIFGMKAYYYHIRNDKRRTDKYLAKSKKGAKKYGLNIIEEWSNHTRKAWANELPKKKMDFWRDHCEESNLVFYQEFDMNVDDIGYFSLPTPVYY